MALSSEQPGDNAGSHEREKEFFIHNLLVRINVTIEMIGEERRLRREGPDGAHCLLGRVVPNPRERGGERESVCVRETERESVCVCA